MVESLPSSGETLGLVLRDNEILEGLESNPSQLQELSGPEDGALTGPVQKRSLKFFCAVEVVLPPYGCKSPGVGIAEEPLHQPGEEGLSSAEGGWQECVCVSVCPSVFLPSLHSCQLLVRPFHCQTTEVLGRIFMPYSIDFHIGTCLMKLLHSQ